MADETRLLLLFHADRAPEFVETPSLGYVVRASNPGEPGTVDYEAVGRVDVPALRDDEGRVVEYATVRAFAHPDLIEEIRSRGERLKVPREMYV